MAIFRFNKNDIKCWLKDKISYLIHEPIFYLICILLFALYLRLQFFVGQGFYDDPTYLYSAYRIYEGISFIPGNNFWELRIGVYYPIAFFWKLFGINELTASLYFILCSLGSVVVTYLIAKEFFSKKIALFSSFLISFFPMNIIYSTQIGPDIPLQFFLGLAVLFFIYQEKNKSLSSIYALLCGVFIGISYTVKSFVILLIPLFVAYILVKIYRKKNFRFLFKKKKIIKYSLIILGFLLIFSVHLVHFHNVTGEWFFVEETRAQIFSSGPNCNSNYWWYPSEMFSLESDIVRNLGFGRHCHVDDSYGYFDTIHDEPLFGFFYYFVVLASLWYIIRRKSKNFFFILWWFGFFFFYEFFLQFYCTVIVDYCVYARIPRFLTTLSIPAIILVGNFLYFEPKIKKSKVKNIRSILCVVAIIFLLVTSINTAYQGSKFLRNGMGEIRETADYLQTLPPKKIYVPHGIFKHKAQFFFEYEEEYLDNITYYNCRCINCSQEYYNSGEFISDAYVVTEGTTYWDIHVNQEGLPDCVLNIPESWELLKVGHLDNYGVFNRYDPKIYYVPEKTN